MINTQFNENDLLLITVLQDRKATENGEKNFDEIRKMNK